jgi:hypothetical protein
LSGSVLLDFAGAGLESLHPENGMTSRIERAQKEENRIVSP